MAFGGGFGTHMGAGGVLGQEGQKHQGLSKCRGVSIEAALFGVTDRLFSCGAGGGQMPDMDGSPVGHGGGVPEREKSAFGICQICCWTVPCGLQRVT